MQEALPGYFVRRKANREKRRDLFLKFLPPLAAAAFLLWQGGQESVLNTHKRITVGAPSAHSVSTLPKKEDLKNTLKVKIKIQDSLTVPHRPTKETVLSETQLPKDILQFAELFKNDKLFLKRVQDQVIDSNLITHIQKSAASYFKLNKRMPKLVFARLVLLLPALVSQESRLNFTAQSKVGAYGLAQIMPNTYSELASYIKRKKLRLNNFTGDYKKDTADPKLAVALALLHFDRFIYPTIKRQLNDLFAVLGISKQGDKALKLSAYFALNAYNAGQGTIKQALANFVRHLLQLKNKNAQEFENIKHLSAEELFVSFTKLAKQNSWHRFYGKDASEYALKILAANQLLQSFVDYEQVFKAVAQNSSGIGDLVAATLADDSLK